MRVLTDQVREVAYRVELMGMFGRVIALPILGNRPKELPKQAHKLNPVRLQSLERWVGPRGRLQLQTLRDHQV